MAAIQIIYCALEEDNSRKERKGTLIECVVVLSQMLVFEERENRSTRRKPLGAE